MHRYMVIELKATEFMPEYIGKLNFYCSAERFYRAEKSRVREKGISGNMEKTDFTDNRISDPVQHKEEL